MTLRSGAHKTPRSLRPFPLSLIQQGFCFCPSFYIWDLFTLSVFCLPTKSDQLGCLATLVQKASLVSASWTCGLDLQADVYLCVSFSRAGRVAIPCFSCSSGLSDLFFFCRWENNKDLLQDLFFLLLGFEFRIFFMCFFFFFWCGDGKGKAQ